MKTQEEVTRIGNPRKPEGTEGEEMLERMNQSHYEVTGWALSYWEIQEDDRVLDIGCGGGATLHRMAEKVTSGHVTGVDYSDVSVETSRRNNEKNISSGKMEVRRVLKAGGTFLLVADIYQNGNLTEREKENIRNYHLFNPTKEEFEQLFINAGFTDIQIHTRKGENWICVEGGKRA